MFIPKEVGHTCGVKNSFLGCKDNLGRTIVLPAQKTDPKTLKLTFQPGQVGALVCKEAGCPVPILYLTIGKEVPRGLEAVRFLRRSA